MDFLIKSMDFLIEFIIDNCQKSNLALVWTFSLRKKIVAKLIPSLMLLIHLESPILNVHYKLSLFLYN